MAASGLTALHIPPLPAQALPRVAQTTRRASTLHPARAGTSSRSTFRPVARRVQIAPAGDPGGTECCFALVLPLHPTAAFRWARNRLRCPARARAALGPPFGPCPSPRDGSSSVTHAPKPRARHTSWHRVRAPAAQHSATRCACALRGVFFLLAQGPFCVRRLVDRCCARECIPKNSEHPARSRAPAAPVVRYCRYSLHCSRCHTIRAPARPWAPRSCRSRRSPDSTGSGCTPGSSARPRPSASSGAAGMTPRVAKAVHRQPVLAATLRLARRASECDPALLNPAWPRGRRHSHLRRAPLT